jgi:hypothetical protein
MVRVPFRVASSRAKRIDGLMAKRECVSRKTFSAVNIGKIRVSHVTTVTWRVVNARLALGGVERMTPGLFEARIELKKARIRGSSHGPIVISMDMALFRLLAVFTLPEIRLTWTWKPSWSYIVHQTDRSS